MVIPCYKAKYLVPNVVSEVLKVGEELGDLCLLRVLVVDDACPQQSWREIADHPQVQVLHHIHNRGVGAATLTGLHTALQMQCQAMVKLDADGQHPPAYLLDLVPYLLSQPASEVALVRGSRYHWPSQPGSIPLTRQVGSILLEPMARAALACRNLTDTSNGFLGLNHLSCRYLLASEWGPRLQKRYLFESSVLVRSTWLGMELREFAMLPHYEGHWQSSMECGAMVIPLLIFWCKSTLSRLYRCYLASITLGSCLLLMTTLSTVLAVYLWTTRIGPEIAEGIQVSAGTSSAFTVASATALIAMLLFLLYEYQSGTGVKSRHFPARLRDLEGK